jgi:hypothetical protein
MGRGVESSELGADLLDTAALAQTLSPVDPAVLHRERVAQRTTARVAHHGLAIDGAHVTDLLIKADPSAPAVRLGGLGVILFGRTVATYQI